MKAFRMSLSGQILLAFISVGLLPVIFISVFSNYLLRRETSAMMEDSYREVAYYSAQNIDNMLEKYNDTSKMTYQFSGDDRDLVNAYDGMGLARVLKNQPRSSAELITRTNTINDFMRMVYLGDPKIVNVMFVESDGTVHSISRLRRRIYSTSAFLEFVQHENAAQWGSELMVFPTHLDNYFTYSDNNVFTLGRNYFDLSEPLGADIILGTLYIDISASVIDDIFKRLEIYRKGEVFILDETDALVYASPGYDITQEAGQSNASVLEIMEVVERAGWRVFVRTDYSRAMGGIVSLQRLTYIIGAIVVAVLFILMLVYTRVFLKPISALLSAMGKVQNGDFDCEIALKRNDELGLLFKGFNEMVKKLEKHIQVSYLEKIHAREAELSALKAQIQPHFLYNSLEIIHMNAILHNDESTGKLALSLADQMHYVMGSIDELVTLDKELEMLHAYFDFIDIRYEHKITYDIDINDDLMDAMVLSLIIQPAVENAIVHGLKPIGHGHVQISIVQQNGNLSIRVMDNGVGMDEITMRVITEQINQTDYTIAESDESIGLKNVHSRIKFKYGDEYGITLSSQMQIGTSVTIKLPLIREVESDV